MTSREMILEFQRLLIMSDKALYELERPTTSEMYMFLNMSQKRIFKDRYFPSANVIENIGTISYNAEEIRHLIKTSDWLSGNQDDSTPISYDVDISSLNGYAHYITGLSKVTRSDVFPANEYTIVPNKVITYAEMGGYITNNFHSPIIRKPATLFLNSTTIKVFVDKFTSVFGGLKITYLSFPRDIDDDNNCELAEVLHNDLVSFAVDLFRNNRYLLYSNNKEQKE